MLSSQFTVPPATEPPIPWDVVEYEEPGSWWTTPTAGELVIPFSGLWSVVVMCGLSFDFPGPDFVFIELFRNSAYWRWIQVPNPDYIQALQLVALGDLVEDDVIYASIYHTDTTDGYVVNDAASTRIDIARIGPKRWT